MPHTNSSFSAMFDKECDYCGRKFRESKKNCPHCGKVNIDAILKDNNFVFTPRISARPRSDVVEEEKLRYDDDL